jgi:hypothetical protein
MLRCRAAFTGNRHEIYSMTKEFLERVIMSFPTNFPLSAPLGQIAGPASAIRNSSGRLCRSPMRPSYRDKPWFERDSTEDGHITRRRRNGMHKVFLNWCNIPVLETGSPLPLISAKSRRTFRDRCQAVVRVRKNLLPVAQS